LTLGRRVKERGRGGERKRRKIKEYYGEKPPVEKAGVRGKRCAGGIRKSDQEGIDRTSKWAIEHTMCRGRRDNKGEGPECQSRATRIGERTY